MAGFTLLTPDEDWYKQEGVVGGRAIRSSTYSTEKDTLRKADVDKSGWLLESVLHWIKQPGQSSFEADDSYDMYLWESEQNVGIPTES